MASPIDVARCDDRLMACPPTCGAAAAMVCSAEAFASRHGLDRSVRIAPRP
jgi:hypothetical protein